MKRAASDIIEIGQKLVEVKAALGHGKFGDWLRAEFGWSDQTALNFMNVARRFGEIPNGLEFAPRALYLLSSPSTPTEAREEALERALTPFPPGSYGKIAACHPRSSVSRPATETPSAKRWLRNCKNSRMTVT